jgi:hypothetical protein
VVHLGHPLVTGLGEINNIVNACSFNEDVKTRFYFAPKSSYTVQTVPGFEPSAKNKLGKALDKFNNLKFEMLDVIVAMTDAPLHKIEETPKTLQVKKP